MVIANIVKSIMHCKDHSAQPFGNAVNCSAVNSEYRYGQRTKQKRVEMDRSKIHIVRVPEGEKKDNGAGRLFDEIMAKTPQIW